MKLNELADLIGGTVSGDPDAEITGVSGIGDSKEGDITYLLDEKGLKEITTLSASALIVKRKLKELPVNFLISDNPQFTFARALEVFYSKPFKASGVSEKAHIGRNVNMGHDVSIHPNALVSDNVSLGSRVTISSGTFIGEGTSIDDGSFIYPNTTIRENVRIGRNVIVHSGAVIGSDGYGYVPEKGQHYKIPQVGGVIIEDNVEVGANVCIDRATVGNTTIGEGTKIDNLVQIAHNVRIGKNCLIVAQAGISGSVELGDWVIIAGQVGIRDHVKVGSKAIVAAQSGIGNNIPEGQVYSGSPAIPHSKFLRAQSLFMKLPEIVNRVRSLEKKILKEEQSDDEHP